MRENIEPNQRGNISTQRVKPVWETKKGKRKIKVCGMRNPVNIEAVLDVGVHYMGFIFYESSARHIDEQAELTLRSILPDLPFLSLQNNTKKVGVFVDAPKEYVLDKVEKFELDYVQLHGRESVFYCSALKKEGVKIIKAFSVDERFRFTNTDFYQFDCDYFLFDTKGAKRGGNGTQFNWDLLNQYDGKLPFFLSGGIGAADIEAVQDFKHPQLHAIDVNSKFEIEPALKDVDLLKQFVQNFKK